VKEVISMWRHTRMIILVALSAAIYAAVLIPFKGGIPLIPGVTEIRPANVFPAIFGLMFGPAGAWGSAIGNFIGDLFGGTIGWGSIFGAIGNFFKALIMYKLWGAIGLVTTETMAQTTNSGRKLLAYLFVTLVSSVAGAVILAWYIDLAGLVPFAALSIIVSLNNFVAAAVLGPILLVLLYPRMKRWGLMWTDIMDKEEVSAGFARGVGALLLTVGAIGGLVVGLGISTGLYGQALLQRSVGAKGQIGVTLAVLPFLLLIVLASFMLSGREQFVEEEETLA
jgi:energy-coupling factor transport system substrate-specific component